MNGTQVGSRFLVCTVLAPQTFALNIVVKKPPLISRDNGVNSGLGTALAEKRLLDKGLAIHIGKLLGYPNPQRVHNAKFQGLGHC